MEREVSSSKRARVCARAFDYDRAAPSCIAELDHLLGLRHLGRWYLCKGQTGGEWRTAVRVKEAAHHRRLSDGASTKAGADDFDEIIAETGSRIQPGEFGSLKLPPLEMQTFARAWSGGKRHRDLTESLSGDTHIKLSDTSCDYLQCE